jgi:hypothetical protein
MIAGRLREVFVTMITHCDRTQFGILMNACMAQLSSGDTARIATAIDCFVDVVSKCNNGVRRTLMVTQLPTLLSSMAHVTAQLAAVNIHPVRTILLLTHLQVFTTDEC